MDARFQTDGPGSNQQSPSYRRGTPAILGLVHDFRNLLQLASSSARIVRREMVNRSDDRLASMLEEALGALDRANLLAQRLSGTDAAECETDDILLQEIVPELRSLLSRALGGKVRIESLVAENLQPLRCDRLQFENVLLNLALNARQAMPDGGTLVIEAVPCVERDHSGCIALSVSDTGRGMPQDIAEQAFRPFFSTRLLEGGKGLGLFNVQAFAEGLGGSVQLTTAPNAGTRVLLHLPGAHEADAAWDFYPDRPE
jgi:signal transduction histidine kinase